VTDALNLAESLMSVEEVAEFFRVPVSWVYEHTRRRSPNRIPGFRLGKYWRFRKGDVLAWIERQQVGGRSHAWRGKYNLPRRRKRRKSQPKGAYDSTASSRWMFVDSW
jgi:excisionase family DNA binding protein